MKSITIILLAVVLLGCEKPNSKPSYGDTGLPKNCKAVIKANLEMYKKIRLSGDDYESQMIDIDGVMDSIDRNCGEYGYAWENN